MSELRCFRNPFSDYDPEIHKSYTIDDQQSLNLIKEYIERISSGTDPNNVTTRRRGDLYVGDAGIAYMYLKLHLAESTKKIFTQKSGLDLARLYIESAKKCVSGRKEKSLALLSGDAGIHAVSAVINYVSGDLEQMEKDLNLFLEGFIVCKELYYAGNDSSDEFLVGRSGYLAGIYWLNSMINPMPISNEIIHEICSVMLESGRRYSEKEQLPIPIMYEYHGKEYLGAAHGLCSILWSFLESPWFLKPSSSQNFIKIPTTKLQEIKKALDCLLELQDSDGSFPTKWSDFGRTLIHWCHGSPGTIYLLAKAYLIFGDEIYLTACIKCADNIWDKGLLLKGFGICHGLAGNGYTFLLMYRLTGDKKYLYRAGRFMEFLTNKDFKTKARTPDRPFSLFEGLAGTVCYLIDVISPDVAYFPFMDVFKIKFNV